MLHCKDLTVLSVKYGPFNMDFKIGLPIINRISLLKSPKVLSFKNPQVSIL